MKRKRAAAEKYHDRVAGIYDSIYDGKPYWRLVRAISWRHLLRWLPDGQAASARPVAAASAAAAAKEEEEPKSAAPGASAGRRCLDLGCGTGYWGRRLLPFGWEADFLDISQKMLDQAALKAAPFGRRLVAHDALPAAGASPVPQPIPERTPGTSIFWHATIDRLEHMPDAAYDLIVGQGDPLGCALRPERVLRELARMLAPGGLAALSVDNRWQGLEPYLKKGDYSGLCQFLADGRTRWITDAAEERYPVATFAPGDIRSLCEAAGLELLSLIGKTVLPLRRFGVPLDDPAQRARWLRLEEAHHAEESLLANAAHLEFVARRPAADA